MSFIEIKTIKGNQYAYLRDSYRESGTQKVKHHHLGYLGRVSSIQDRSISVERTEPISKPIKESIGTRIKETTLPKTKEDKRTRIKLDVAIKGYAGYGTETTGKEQVRRVLTEEEKKKKKKLKRKLIIPTEEEMKKEKEEYEDMFFPLGGF